MRPILSTIGTHTYSLSKYIIPFIDQWANNEYTVKNSFDFVNFLTNFNVNNNCTMASFDVTSLYTNIPLNETINIIIELAFDNRNIFNSYTKNLFKKLLEIVLLDSYFIFNQELYSQIDGLAMGSPVAPILANIFLSYHEQRWWLRDCPGEFKPILYRRFVDDTFFVFNDKSNIDKFLQYLNNKHSNIKFTKDLE